MKYCGSCAHEVVRKIPEGEDRERDVAHPAMKFSTSTPRLLLAAYPL